MHLLLLALVATYPQNFGPVAPASPVLKTERIISAIEILDPELACRRADLNSISSMPNMPYGPPWSRPHALLVFSSDMDGVSETDVVGHIWYLESEAAAHRMFLHQSRNNEQMKTSRVVDFGSDGLGIDATWLRGLHYDLTYRKGRFVVSIEGRSHDMVLRVGSVLDKALEEFEPTR